MIPRIATFLTFLAIGAVLSAQPAPQSTAPEPAKPAATQPAEPPPAGSPALPVDPNAYKIGAEDAIFVQVWRDAELSRPYIVRPDGKISLPLVGELKIQDMTPLEVQNKLVELYSKFLNRPEITVSLTRVGSKKYFLVGQVMRTGMFPLVVPTTVMEAINGAGGFQEFAKKSKVVIIRGSQRIKFNYDEVVKGKKLEQNIQVENGDHIFVP